MLGDGARRRASVRMWSKALPIPRRRGSCPPQVRPIRQRSRTRTRVPTITPIMAEVKAAGMNTHPQLSTHAQGSRHAPASITLPCQHQHINEERQGREPHPTWTWDALTYFWRAARRGPTSNEQSPNQNTIDIQNDAPHPQPRPPSPSLRNHFYFPTPPAPVSPRVSIPAPAHAVVPTYERDCTGECSTSTEAQRYAQRHTQSRREVRRPRYAFQMRRPPPSLPPPLPPYTAPLDLRIGSSALRYAPGGHGTRRGGDAETSGDDTLIDDPSGVMVLESPTTLVSSLSLPPLGPSSPVPGRGGEGEGEGEEGDGEDDRRPPLPEIWVIGPESPRLGLPPLPDSPTSAHEVYDREWDRGFAEHPS